jgi:tripartite-type tricarboxylate transporter receptor subunit TctC
MAMHTLTRTIAVLCAAMLVAVACGGATQPGATAAPTTAATAAATAAPTAAPFALLRPVEFIISTSPGGGSDTYARVMQGIIEKAKLTNHPVQPVNKDGGSGAVAFNYVFEKKADPHVIFITLNSFFLTMAIQRLPYQASDFTPVANLALDPFFLWVHNDSPWKTAQDFIKAAQAEELAVIGTGSKQEDEVVFRNIQKAHSTKPFRYVSETGGGKVAAALAGKQAVATVNNPSEGLPLYQGATPKIRPICAFLAASPTTGTFKDLPTCKSQGLNVEPYFNTRAIMAPPALTAEQQTYWVGVFKKVSDSQEWKDFVIKNNLDPDFKSGDEFKKLIADLDKLHRDIAKEQGWVQ